MCVKRKTGLSQMVCLPPQQPNWCHLSHLPCCGALPLFCLTFILFVRLCCLCSFLVFSVCFHLQPVQYLSLMQEPHMSSRTHNNKVANKPLKNTVQKPLLFADSWMNKISCEIIRCGFILCSMNFVASFGKKFFYNCWAKHEK